MPLLLPPGVTAPEAVAAAEADARDGIGTLHVSLAGDGGKRAAAKEIDIPPRSTASAAHAAAHLCNAADAVRALAWLPRPPTAAAGSAEGDDAEYLAVGTSVHHGGEPQPPSAHAIQLWRMVGGSCALWGEVLHGGCGVLALGWRPYGNALTAAAAEASAMAGGQAPVGRLGLLAAGCADGHIRIFAIPTAAPADAPATPTGDPRRDPASAAAWRLWLPPAAILHAVGAAVPLCIDWAAAAAAGGGTQLAAGTSDGCLVLWRVDRASLIASAPTAEAQDEDEPQDASWCDNRTAYKAFMPAVVWGGAPCNPPDECDGGSTSRDVRAGHTGPVRAVQWAPPPSALVASVGHDGTLLLWEISDAWVPRLRVRAHVGWIFDLAWSPVAPWIFTSADEAKLGVHSLYRGFAFANYDRVTLPSYFGKAAADSQSTIAVWGLDVSACGGRLAASTSEGHLAILRQTFSGYNQTPGMFEQEAVLQLTHPDPSPTPGIDGGPPTDAPEAGIDGMPLVVSLGAAVPPPPPPPPKPKAKTPRKKVDPNEKRKWNPPAPEAKAPDQALPPAPPELALHCTRWNPNAASSEWVATAGARGLVLLVRVPADGGGVAASAAVKMEE